MKHKKYLCIKCGQVYYETHLCDKGNKMTSKCEHCGNEVDSELHFCGEGNIWGSNTVSPDKKLHIDKKNCKHDGDLYYINYPYFSPDRIVCNKCGEIVSLPNDINRIVNVAHNVDKCEHPDKYRFNTLLNVFCIVCGARIITTPKTNLVVTDGYGISYGEHDEVEKDDTSNNTDNVTMSIMRGDVSAGGGHCYLNVNGADVLHAQLKKFAGKKVRLTIKQISEE